MLHALSNEKARFLIVDAYAPADSMSLCHRVRPGTHPVRGCTGKHAVGPGAQTPPGHLHRPGHGRYSLPDLLRLQGDGVTTARKNKLRLSIKRKLTC